MREIASANTCEIDRKTEDHRKSGRAAREGGNEGKTPVGRFIDGREAGQRSGGTERDS